MSLPSLRTLVLLYALTGALAGAISLWADASLNLEVFRAASVALWEQHDIYAAVPYDLYKYSPSFALLFTPFALLPRGVAAVLWPALGFAIAASGMTCLSRSLASASTPTALDPRRVLVFAWPGIVLATDGDQSNMLMAGMCFLALAALADAREVRAGLALALAIAIKLFPAAFVLFLPLSKRPLRAFAALGVSLVVLTLAPMVVVGPHGLLALLWAWWALLVRDRGPQRGEDTNWSIAHALDFEAGAAGMEHAGLAQAIGTALLVLAAVAVGVVQWRLRTSLRNDASSVSVGTARASLVVITLAYLVLFNHRSESTTFVLSAWAAALYLAQTPQPKAWQWALLVLVTLAPGPFYVAASDRVSIASFLGAKRLFHPLRVVPLSLLWIAAQARLASQLRGLRPSEVI